MSEASYSWKEARGFVGPDLPICQPASLELGSPFSYKKSVYDEFQDHINWFSRLSLLQQLRHEDTVGEMITRLLAPLGGLTLQDVSFSTVTTPIGFARVVFRNFRQGNQVIADINYGRAAHSICILPTEQRGIVTIRSNVVQQALQGEVPIQDVARRMHKPVIVQVPLSDRLPRYPWTDANIMGLPLPGRMQHKVKRIYSS